LARDRKRAKQRRERAARGAGSLSPNKPVRTEVPGALDHGSGDADEFEAAIVSGADGATLTPQPGETPAELEQELADAEAAAEAAPEPAAAGEADANAESDDGSEDRLQEAAAAFGGRGGRGGAGAQAVAERPSGAPLRGGNRVIGFLRASWAELQRVQWPDRRQVTQATAVVLGFVIVAGVYLGVADVVAKEIVEAIL
jgi:preprotein translocase subunit SecE